MNNQLKWILTIIVSIYLSAITFAQTDNFLSGTNAGANITTGDYNNFIGLSAGFSNTTGSNNFALGYQAAYSLTTGQDNTVIGLKAAYSDMTAQYNVIIGFEAGYLKTNSQRNIFIGEQSGYAAGTSTDNTFVGYQTGYKTTTGNQNTFIGYQVGYDNTTGYANCFVGGRGQGIFKTGQNNTTGYHNTAFGMGALADNSVGIQNTCIGYAAGAHSEYPSGLTFVGHQAGWDNNRNNQLNEGERNTYVGKSAGYTNRRGNDNVGIGANADFIVGTGGNSTDVSNAVFIGASTSVGANGVTVIGHSASVTGTNGIAIGKESTASATNSIAIGYQANATNANEVVIGNSLHTSIGGHVNWTATSDGRLKTNIQENVVGLDFINQLRPVTYQFAVGSKQYADSLNTANCQLPTVFSGFIAQEVVQAAQNTNFDFSGIDKPQSDDDYYGLRYAEFVVPLVKAVQELSEDTKQIKSDNVMLDEKIAATLLRLEALENSKSSASE